jgi:UDP-N-acetylmuramoylalanine--D-glutamate ligase
VAEKVLVLGRGTSGRAAAALLDRLGREVLTLDGDDAFPSGDFAFAVASPGIALSHPWMRECAVRGIEVVSELQLGCEELGRQGWKMLAVTGSKGKSSVVKVVAEAIAATGATAVACGNYGRAVSDVALGGGCGWAVVEVRSFQLETTRLAPDTFEAAAILNLQADHLDRHVSKEAYHALKRSLLQMAKRRFGEGDAQDETPFLKGSYFDNEVLRSNGALAVSLMRVAGLDEDAIRMAFASFVPLPHRMNLVLERGGVRYVDDSKATSLSAMAAALKMTGSGVRLIAGGLAKGDDPRSVLADLTKRVKKVYLIGRCAESFFDAWSGLVDCEICGTLERAVQDAKRDARAGETVLLSPGCASYDQFENFGRRGEVFARFAEKEG